MKGPKGPHQSRKVSLNVGQKISVYSPSDERIVLVEVDSTGAQAYVTLNEKVYIVQMFDF